MRPKQQLLASIMVSVLVGTGVVSVTAEAQPTTYHRGARPAASQPEIVDTDEGLKIVFADRKIYSDGDVLPAVATVTGGVRDEEGCIPQENFRFYSGERDLKVKVTDNCAEQISVSFDQTLVGRALVTIEVTDAQGHTESATEEVIFRPGFQLVNDTETVTINQVAGAAAQAVDLELINVANQTLHPAPVVTGDFFTVTLTPAEVPVAGHAQLKITPKAGLPVGEYDGAVTLNGLSIPVHLVVAASPQENQQRRQGKLLLVLFAAIGFGLVSLFLGARTGKPLLPQL